MYINTNFLEQGATLCRYLQSKEAWRTVETLVIVTKDEEFGDGFIDDEEEQEEEAVASAAVSTKRGGKALLHSPTSSSNSNRGTSSSSRSHRSGTNNAALSPAGSDVGNGHNESRTDIPSSPVASSSSSLPSKGSSGGGGTTSSSMLDSGGAGNTSATPVTVKQLFKIVYAFVAKATKLHTVIFDSINELSIEEISYLSKALATTKTKLRWLSFINCPHVGDAGMRCVM